MWKFRGTRKKGPSIAFFTSYLLHGTVHDPTKLYADS